MASDEDFELQQVSSDVNSNEVPEFIQETESRERKEKMVKLAKLRENDQELSQQLQKLKEKLPES